VSNESVTDEIILEGFRSLHQAMAEGFDAMRREINQRFAESEQRMLRHLDRRDERLDNHEHRITTLEAKR
jgi:BMFP domain-containing protein YqiC